MTVFEAPHSVSARTKPEQSRRVVRSKVCMFGIFGYDQEWSLLRNRTKKWVEEHERDIYDKTSGFV
jgi:hypothetical protein